MGRGRPVNSSGDLGKVDFLAKAKSTVPLIDIMAPARIETATFALG